MLAITFSRCVAHRRALATALALTLLPLGCSNGVEEAATTTTTQPAPERTLKLTLVHHFEPNDNSGIGRDTDEEGTPCGVSGLTKRSATLSFMEPGTEALLLDGEGTILAESTLSGPGTAHNIERPNENQAYFDCEWQLSFTNVPEAQFYEVEVGGLVVTTMSFEEVSQSDYDVTAEIQPRTSR